ncbi:MAG TPA: type II toxin-antitoxin system Phd/YefM family antitoxin [Kofleriaceae bacterium]|nr:type II toxin-antitoxin system Phd/YefM family antitoxin [Kofleriaceae bacterium]
MSKIEKIAPISDLQRRSRALVEQVRKTGEPVVLTQRGRPAAMLVNYELYEGHLATLDEMSFPDWRERLAEAEADMAAGRLVDHAVVARRRAPRRRR